MRQIPQITQHTSVWQVRIFGLFVREVQSVGANEGKYSLQHPGGNLFDMVGVMRRGDIILVARLSSIALY